MSPSSKKQNLKTKSVPNKTNSKSKSESKTNTKLEKVSKFLKNKENLRKIAIVGLGSYSLYEASKNTDIRNKISSIKKNIIKYIPISKEILEKVFKNRYTEVKPLGKGAFGVTKLYKNNITNKEVVIKAIPLNKTTEDDIRTELDILKSFKNNCKQYVSCYIEDTVEDGILYIVQSYDYPDTLKMVYETPEFDNIRDTVILNLIKGLQVLHNNGIAHNDIKLENVIVDKNTGYIKYIDFGVSCYKSCHTPGAGTKKYMSPEMGQSWERSSSNMSLNFAQTSDIYTLGIVILELYKSIKNIQNEEIKKTIYEMLESSDKRINLNEVAKRFKIAIKEDAGNWFTKFFGF